MDKRCMQSPNQAEFTLCGDAFDAFDSGDADEPIVMAKPGQTITCEDCRLIISEVKRVRQWVAPKDADEPTHTERK